MLKIIKIKIYNFYYKKIPFFFLILYFYVGPALGICLTSELEEEIEADPDTEEILRAEGYGGTLDVKGITNNIDFGLAMGGGIDFSAGAGRIILGIRYTLDFINVIEVEEVTFDNKNGALSFMLGYGIDFGGSK